MVQMWFCVPFALLVCLSAASLIRKNVEHLSEQDILNLQKALQEVRDDNSTKGYEAIAGYHGFPAQCKHGNKDVACCVHGDLNFPVWHRLLVVQVEQALKEKGLSIGVPYWDWTDEIHHLPHLVGESVFYDSAGGKTRKNAWYRGDIHIGSKVAHTARAVDDRLFQHVHKGEHTDLYEHVLHAFEYESYCDFEVQFEIAHSTIHSLVGGRYPYSLSSLEYTVYDPIFFLHHSNVDRLFQIYHEIQKARGVFIGPNTALCDIKSYFNTLQPFDRETNPFPLTRSHSSPDKARDHSVFGYEYDNLKLNGLDAVKLVEIIKERQSHDRAFADFRLHNIGVSADVKVKVCRDHEDGDDSDDECVVAGDFFLLGGPLEMPWSFSRPYHFEVTDAVKKLGIDLEGSYHIEAEITAVNGTQLHSDVLPHASVSFRPAVGRIDPPIAHDKADHEHEFHDDLVVRKNVDRLTREEIFLLRESMEKFQQDHSIDGYQAIAEFHGDPGKCPFPTDNDRQACCVHGMPNFPHWHRLIVTQVENALKHRGSTIGVPYWDITKPNAHIPLLASERTYVDPHDHKEHNNSFFEAEIAFLGHHIHTERDVLEGLSQSPAWGHHTELFDAFLLALEQDNFCDFEVQFEVAHNLIHAIIGGNTKYGLSSLSYSAFDPIFYIYHSNVDRIWAIWTALQQHRHKPYKAHCAQSYIHLPLKPFSFKSPYNNDEVTREHSVPTNIYDYENELHYAYDSLEFGGYSIAELDNYINTEVRNHFRLFVGIQLHGIGQSGLAKIYITVPGKEKHLAGRFALLGGPTEMPWRFDRLYKHDITPAIEELKLHWAQPYTVTIEMEAFNGDPIDVSQFGHIEISYEPPHRPHIHEEDDDHHEHHIRKNVEHLTQEELLDIRHALNNLEADKSARGYQTLGRFHGAPNWCPSPSADKKFACCPHGMATFPHWHRLLVVQAENALREHGYHGALPYWDWTKPLTELPAIVVPETYIDPVNGHTEHNPFHDAHIDDVNHDTVRAVRPELYTQPEFGKHTSIANQVLLAFEQDDFCDFEVQFEIAHNYIHALVGGTEQYSMASLLYTAYDPLFYLHHSNTDRLWAIWQALQKYRGKAYNTAHCAIGILNKPLAPFGLSHDVNPDNVTKSHAAPAQTFDYKHNFHYEYDNLEFNGLTIPQLQKEIEQHKGEDRVFVGFMLHGIKHSALVKFHIHKSTEKTDHLAGEFYILGDENEKPWAYNRLFKYEITHKLEELHLHYDDRYTIKYTILDLHGNDLGQLFPAPTVIHDVGTSHVYGQEYRPQITAASHIRRNLNSLNDGELESLRSAFLDIQKDHTYEGIASFHGKPGLCEHQGHKVACCVHGNPAFPGWHRLYVELVEHALLHHGSSVAVPYWDWITPIQKLPKLISKATYFNSRENRFDPNPFFSGKIAGEDAVTTRDPQPELYNNEYFYEQALNTLEQEHYCDFEIQFEILHNALHSWLGGHARYSLSSLDYAAFDPVFFLHHANTDRLWAIWQELQRFRGLPYNEADCAINFMRKPLKPFGDERNTDDVTRKYSRPADTFDYRNHFHYEYDNLNFNGLSIPELEDLIHTRKRHGRVFAGFMIHNIGMSADVDVYICVPTHNKEKENCKEKAGTFSVLGGETEMPFRFDRLYKLDITHSVRDLGLPLDNAANFKLHVEIRAPNGSHLDLHIHHDPTIIYVPGTDDAHEHDGSVSNYLVRKNFESLSPSEGYQLVKALIALQADDSPDGFQSIASFHALPPLCPSPTAVKRHACCIHGSAAFLQWHRLYTVQFEHALKRHGSTVGVPYWDWTRVSLEIPRILTNISYTDLFTGVHTNNPFHSARIGFKDRDIERDVQGDKLFKKGPHGWDTWLYNQVLFALEQEDFCDFASQLEITHNAIHSWLGGSKKYSLAHLHYASYDPAFYVHHSNTDRLWAIWQALQKHRGHKPNEANCALEQLREPLKPFSFGPPYNLNKVTAENSRPESTFAYEDHFHYRYDSLEFVGMNIPTLNTYIKERQEHNRVFAGFLLKGFGQSANIEFDICTADDHCFDGGYFTILGGSAELKWEADRLYRYEITSQLEAHGLRYNDDYHFTINITGIDGSHLDAHLIRDPTVIYLPAKHDVNLKKVTVNRIRRDLNTVDERDQQSAQAALRNLMDDHGKNGWAAIASFHGAPALCPDPEHPKVACCQHGMPTFPHWHRLFTLQVELAYQELGSSIAIPYWDWTYPIVHLPELFTSVDYYDPWHDQVRQNPFAHGYIEKEKVYTVRDVQPELYELTKDGKNSALFPLVLEALEQTNFCDFEVHFEILHNYIHYLVGGHETYSLSSLEYSAYDPFFFIHHSFVDKLWVVWQELQQRRHLDYHRADCAVNAMNEPLKPFNFENVNTNKFTREHAVPNTLFDHETLGYAYDHLNVGGHSLDEIEQLINEHQRHARVFAGFLLKGIKTSGSIKIKICKGDKCTSGGQFNLLGGPLESPWAYDRLYKREITHYLEDLDLHAEDVFDPTLDVHVEVEVHDVHGKELNARDVLPRPTIIYDPAHGGAEDVSSTSVAGIGVRKDVSHLSSSEIHNLREALEELKKDQGPNGFQSLAAYHGSPGKCDHHGHPVACCVHGGPNFPHWHRLYVKQWEDALTAHGAKVGIPYWEWTTAFRSLPHLVTDDDHNPFHDGYIEHEHQHTSRAPRKELFNDPEFGDQSFFYRQVLLAFEQTDYCDFEVQFEIAHNAIHSWVGGTSPYGMSTLEYTAYDPLFLLHHSNVDRQFAIWQALQKYRGLPYNSAYCSIRELHQPLRPFSDHDNPNPTTHSNAHASDVFDYDRLHYQYEDLDFHGKTIHELNDQIEKRQEEDRIFAQFQLHNIHTSADVTFELCDDHKHCEFAGTFAILGGPLEMDWEFDRLFQYDVTNVFRKLHLHHDSSYHFHDHITAVNGTKLDSRLIPPPKVKFVPGVKRHQIGPKATEYHPDFLLRKNVNQLTLKEARSLKEALHKLQQDQGLGGFEAIAGFHGAPFLCPEHANEKYACCVHGMPIFPHWHRLFTVQFEQALKSHGALTGIPYWDWTNPGHELPSFFADTSSENPFSGYDISFEGHRTSRSPLEALFRSNSSAGNALLYELTLDALEEDDFCHFEVMLEFLHNRVHFLIGGSGDYSMSTLDYSAFDPIFMIVHSSMDRIWVLWQELQKLRHKPFAAVSCGDKSFHTPLHPFDYPGINTNELTRNNAIPDRIFDHQHLGYEYDSTDLHEHNAADIKEIIRKRHSKTRVYLGGTAHGIGHSLSTEISVLNDKGERFVAGTNFILGSSKEMPWSNEILFKFDITDAVHKAGVPIDHNIKFHYKVNIMDSHGVDTAETISDMRKTYTGIKDNITEADDYAIFVLREAYTDYLTLNIPIGLSYKLPAKVVVPKGTHVRFLPVTEDYNEPLENLVSYTNLHKCTLPPFSFHQYAQNVVHALEPGDYYFASTNKDHCLNNRKIYIHVQDH